MRANIGWVTAWVLFCVCGCTQTKPEKNAGPRKPNQTANQTEGSDVHAPPQIDYHAVLTLKQNGLQKVLSSKIYLNIIAKQTLSRLDLWPGLHQNKIADHLTLDHWQWDLFSITSDRPLTLSAQPWSLVLQTQQPVEKGDLWHIEMEYRRPIRQVDLACQGASPLLRTLEGLQNRDSFTNLVGEGDFYVLQPRLPLLYDCNGKDPSMTFAPMTCVARHDLHAKIHIELPDGWQAVFPSRVTWIKGKNQSSLAQLTRIPAVFAIAPSLVYKKLSLDQREIQLCAPAKRNKDLETLASLVKRIFPILEKVLGSYPKPRPTICLSPYPVSAHSQGSLAFVSRLQAGESPAFKSASQKQPKSQTGWDSLNQSQLLVEDELIRAMALQWWRYELPQRYQDLFEQGLKAYASKTILQQQYQDNPDQLSLLSSLPWLGLDQTHVQKYVFTSIKTYLKHQTVLIPPYDQLTSELHGLLIFDLLFGDKAHQSQLRSLLSQPESVGYYPNQLMESFAELNCNFKSIVQSDQHIQLPTGRLIKQYKAELRSRLLQTFPAQQRKTCLPAAYEQNPSFKKPTDAAFDWATIAEVANHQGVEGCRDKSSILQFKQKCMQMFRQEGPNALADIMDRSQLKKFLSQRSNPTVSNRAKQLEPDANKLAHIYEQAELLSRSAALVQDKEAQYLRKALPVGQAFASLLYARIRAKWAARIFMTHWPDAKRYRAVQTSAESFIHATTVGYVRPGSPADRCGLRFGDTIRAIDDQRISNWKQVKNAIRKSAGHSLHVVVQRGKKLVHMRISPQPVHDLFGQTISYDTGINHNLVGNLIGVLADSPASIAGLRQADRIVEINTQPVLYWEQIREILENNGNKPLALKIARYPAKSASPAQQTFLEFQLRPVAKKHAPAHTFTTKSAYFGFEPIQMYLDGTTAGKAAQQAGLKPADKIIKVNSTPVYTWRQFLQICHSLKEDQIQLGIPLVVRRGAALKKIVLHPNVETKQEQEREVKRLSIGLMYKPNFKSGNSATHKLR